MEEAYYGVIDIGSNTMRLVIYEKRKSNRIHEIENVKSVVRLRKYLDENQYLKEEGIKLLISTLKVYQEVINEYPLTELICAATATVRQAKNNAFFKKLIKQELGWDIQILSGEEEAFYGYLAVVNSTSIEEGITIDIGGGSTEVTYFKDRIMKEYHSLPFGVITLQSFFQKDVSNAQAVSLLLEFLHKEFENLGWIKNKNVPIIAIGGSARNLAQIDQSLRKYPLAGLHQYKMQDSNILKVLNHLIPLNREELEKVEGLSSDRADTIIPAITVFLTLYQITNAPCFLLSRKGLRDGLYYEKLTKNFKHHLYPNVIEDSIHELVYEYNLNFKHINQHQALTKKLFNGIKQRGLGDLTESDWILLERACHVFHLGKYIDSESSAQHTFYLLANRTIDGLDHIERLKLAFIASYKNKTVFNQFLQPFNQWFLKEEKKKLALLGAIIKIAYSLNATKRAAVSDLSISIDEDIIKIKVICKKNFQPELYQTNKQKKHLEKVLKKSIEFDFVNEALLNGD